MITLEAVTAANLDDALAVRVAPEQEHLVRPVVRSLAEAYVNPGVAWPRLVVDDGVVVAFVMAFVDSTWDDDPADVRSGVWRLNVDRHHQGRGYGTFAVRAVCDELRGRGAAACHVTYHRGPGSPEPFYARLGFVATGELSGDQTVARLALDPLAAVDRRRS
ncbi:GNAT family N-acetyltransferase [Microlunatus flavus]|uniref:Diamine N-acetyltransferase n=1 Tax=Microlunatus flavus TaxID=1036181 RepID=A0A1H9J1X1_9ACTN|nr:GNAT family N-acetyltransferase [Microlunatus flavus]SEQ80823.1 diamine N-acetyltransferase [Microlunatus flavus]